MPNPEGLSATIWPQEPSAFRSMHGGALRGLARLRITSHAFMAAEKHSQTVEDYHYFAQRTILAWKRQRAEEEQALARKRQRRDEEISHEPSWCVSQILRQLKEAIGWTIGPIAMRLAEVKSHSSLLRDAPVTASFQDFNWNWSLQFEDRLRLRAAYNPVLAEDTVLTSSQSYKLTAHDLRTLENLTWLNDEVVNIYFSLIQRRSEERPALEQGRWVQLSFCIPLDSQGRPLLIRFDSRTSAPLRALDAGGYRTARATNRVLRFSWLCGHNACAETAVVPGGGVA
eukprot:TRINITY_DN3472_c0_g1_i7.p1 TRINITY_DN3472_c0_g1~~TRINITY_DN3472_c0_g1_i7.p1  ORF type:complete len:285 (+),score=29.32 TRINITY_DN3472_c0_g1_i7:48-902(+)